MYCLASLSADTLILHPSYICPGDNTHQSKWFLTSFLIASMDWTSSPPFGRATQFSLVQEGQSGDARYNPTARLPRYSPVIISPASKPSSGGSTPCRWCCHLHGSWSWIAHGRWLCPEFLYTCTRYGRRAKRRLQRRKTLQQYRKGR